MTSLDTRGRRVRLSRVPDDSTLRVSKCACSLVSRSAVRRATAACESDSRNAPQQRALATDRFEIQEYKMWQLCNREYNRVEFQWTGKGFAEASWPALCAQGYSDRSSSTDLCLSHPPASTPQRTSSAFRSPLDPPISSTSPPPLPSRPSSPQDSTHAHNGYRRSRYSVKGDQPSPRGCVPFLRPRYIHEPDAARVLIRGSQTAYLQSLATRPMLTKSLTSGSLS